MTKNEIMAWLAEHGSAQTRKVLRRHGALDPFYGVKITDLKKILTGHRNNDRLASELWDTGNSNAMYLATLMADHRTISRERLQTWMSDAYWYLLSEVAVAALAAESPYGWELGLQWIESPREMVAAGGWGTLSSWISLRDDSELDLAVVRTHLHRIADHIHTAQNRVRYAMNNYIICAAAYVQELYDTALTVAQGIGTVTVDMGETSCQTPFAPDYIKKISRLDRVGRKRPHARC